MTGFTHAQTRLDEIEIISDEEDTPRTGDVVESEHTGSRSRITRTQLEQPGSQLGSLLGSVSGVQQKQSAGFGTFSSVTVRAASAAQTAVFLDGIMLNSGGDPVIDLSTLEILNLSSVDIYKGSAPLQLGHGGIGGAVNLNTPASQASSKPTIRLGVGSFSQLSLSAANQVRAGKWDWTGSATQQQSKNDYILVNDNGTPLNPNDDSRKRHQNNQVRRSSLLFKGGYQLSASKRTDILLQISERDAGVPTTVNLPDNDASYQTLNSQLQLSQTIDQWRGWNTRHALYRHQADSLYDDSQSDIGLGKQYIDTDTTTLGARTYWEKFIDAGTLGLSIDIREESLNQEDKFNDDDNVAADRNLLFATAHLAFANSTEKILVTPALRWQQSRRKGRSTSPRTPNSVQTITESELGAQLGVSLTLTPVWTFNANVGNFFREPSFSELYSSTGLYTGNRNLQPEKGVNTDVSLTYKNDAIQIEATLFQSLRDDLIVTVYDSRGYGSARNTGRSKVTGLELSTNWTPSTVWRISANATLQNPRNQDTSNGLSGNVLPGEARQSAFARIQYQPSHVAYWYEWQATRKKYYDVDNLLLAADTSLHDIGVDIKRGLWKFSARLQNAGNDYVEDFNGFPKPGRSFSMAVTRTL